MWKWLGLERGLAVTSRKCYGEMVQKCNRGEVMTTIFDTIYDLRADLLLLPDSLRKDIMLNKLLLIKLQAEKLEQNGVK